MTTNRHIDEPAGPGTPKPTYRERRERRMGKREEWAEKRDEKGVSAREKAGQAVEGIPPGQPTLVGHHSEAGHRRALARHDAAMRQSFEHGEMADRHAQAAETIGRQLNQSIYSDDVDAAERLRQRIGRLEAERERIKAINVHIRKTGSVEGLDLSEKEKKDLFLAARINGTRGYPPYALQNLSGNISRQRKRLNQLLSERPSMDEPKEGPTAGPVRETPSAAPGLAAAPAPPPETGPRLAETARTADPVPSLPGRQATLGTEFATGRNLPLPVVSRDFGEKRGPLTVPPAQPEPDQFALPETPPELPSPVEPEKERAAGGFGAAEGPLPPPSALPSALPSEPPAEASRFSAPMTEEQSRRAGSGLETDPETGRTLTPAERWEADANRPVAAPAQPAGASEPPAVSGREPAPSQPTEPDQAAYQRARLDRDCPLPDGDACIAIVRPETLRTDARMFQYKAETDDQGVSVKLADVKTWDPDLAGVAYVWERADGGRFIVDGHQRLALARRLRREGQEPELLVKIWREADGYTPKTMRLAAAKKNIAEGSGTAVDAARVLREEPGLFDTLSQKNAIVRDARGLARLDQEVFSETVEYVNAGRLPENVASLLADVGPDPALQRGALREFVREQGRGHISRAAGETLLYAIRRNRLDEVEAQAQGTLTGFDLGAVRGSAWRERAALQQGLTTAFRHDRRLFGEVVRGDSRLEAVGNVLAEESNETELTAARSNIELFDRLANKRGPLADYLDAEAVRIKERMDRTGASRQGVTAAATRDSVRYLRPWLRTYTQDGGAALADAMAAERPAPTAPRSSASAAAAVRTPQPAVTILPEVPEATQGPQPARRRITGSDVAGGISGPTPAPDATPARPPVTVAAVKKAGGSAVVQTASKPRQHIQAPEAGACPAPVKTAKRPQPRAENGSATPKLKRARRKSDFTPAEIRRFRRAVSRMKR